MCLPPKPKSPTHLFTTCFELTNNKATIIKLHSQINLLKRELEKSRSEELNLKEEIKKLNETYSSLGYVIY